MKKAKVLLAGALVLALGLVMGCKQGIDSGNPNWTTDDNKLKVWEQDNSSDQYVRAAKQFGNSTKTKDMVVKLEITDLTTSKAGLVFGINELDKTAKTYNYFVLGVGGVNYTKTQGDVYLSYYRDVDVKKLDEASKGKQAPGNRLDIFDNETITTGAMKIVGSTGTIYVAISESKSESDNKTTVTIKLGSSYDPKLGVTGTTMEKTFEIGTDAKVDSYITTGGGDANWMKNLTTIDGGIGAYGMLKPGNGTTINAKNTYEVIKPSTVLSAE